MIASSRAAPIMNALLRAAWVMEQLLLIINSDAPVKKTTAP